MAVGVTPGKIIHWTTVFQLFDEMFPDLVCYFVEEYSDCPFLTDEYPMCFLKFLKNLKSQTSWIPILTLVAAPETGLLSLLIFSGATFDWYILLDYSYILSLSVSLRFFQYQASGFALRFAKVSFWPISPSIWYVKVLVKIQSVNLFQWNIPFWWIGCKVNLSLNK